MVGVFGGVRDFLDRNRAWTYGSLAVLVVALAGLWVFASHAGSKERRAGERYAGISAQFPDDENADAGRWEALIPEIEKFIAENGGTRARVNAQMDLAKACFFLKRYDKAVNAATAAIEEADLKSPLFDLARYQLALIYQEMGKADEALAQWTLLNKDSLEGIGREIEWHMAKIYEGKGDYPKAVERLEKALNAPGPYPPAPLLSEELAILRSRTQVQDSPSRPIPSSEGGEKSKS